MSETTQVMPLSEIVGYSDPGRPTWRPIRSMLGIGAFGVNAWQATEAGQQLIGAHDEVSGGAAEHEELYLVLSGKARFTVDDREYDAPAGTLVFVADPSSTRGAVADEAGTTILAIGAKRGEAFSVSPWERSAEALRYWPTKEWDRAIEILEREAEARPDSGGILYNLACAEARAGLHDDALGHLERAVTLEERFRELAQSDSDLESLRADERFPKAAA